MWEELPLGPLACKGSLQPPSKMGGTPPLPGVQRPLLPLSLHLMLVPLSPITSEKQLGMIGILWEGVLGTSLACQPVPCRVHFCWHLIIFHFLQLSGQLPDRSLNYAWSQSAPADTFLFGPSRLTALGENRYKADWQERSWESECAQPGTPFHFLHCHWHPKTTPSLLMVLFLRNLNIVNYVLIGTELNTQLHPEHPHMCLILSCYQGPAWEGPSFAPIIADACMTFLVAQMVKNLPAMQETWVRSLGQKERREGNGNPGEGNGNPLQYSCWRIPWTEEPGRLQPMMLQRVRHYWATNTLTLCKHFHDTYNVPATVMPVLQVWASLSICIDSVSEFLITSSKGLNRGNI